MPDIVEAILEPGGGPGYGGRMALAMRRCYSAEDPRGLCSCLEGAFADKMSSIPKCVASTTLKKSQAGAHHMITISAFKRVPEFAQGQVRDLRARWALEEAGLPYKTRLLEQGDQDKSEYRALQHFGQVPILEEDGFVIFESGAIVYSCAGICTCDMDWVIHTFSSILDIQWGAGVLCLAI